MKKVLNLFYLFIVSKKNKSEYVFTPVFAC